MNPGMPRRVLQGLGNVVGASGPRVTVGLAEKFSIARADLNPRSSPLPPKYQRNGDHHANDKACYVFIIRYL